MTHVILPTVSLGFVSDNSTLFNFGQLKHLSIYHWILMLLLH
jgi:hypothetical protein